LGAIEIMTVNEAHQTKRRIDERVTIGHVHLKVSDLERSLAFYCGVLGFELMQRSGTQAAFMSAGGYHHHIGLNTWESLGGSPPSARHDRSLSRRYSLPDARRVGGCLAASHRRGHSARRRNRSRRERGALFARSR
jgi:catechol-2,3-dioxygenase